ncbi:helix-turn-helix domain-containing protein [Sulfobacillus harzensis]|uniref:Helix-turn-helix domain-containing protein n=1 Tax=Sulfobacillus harzensis TaxID=2729629 RepID=A0A7Y0Q1U5_9FIRM|nr:helix-turn-helix domain-containing protein [Sulfobacillus harzensis]NMP21797.1 helix-turn-helix domain-containing protein [Sulfobacillus harzensis]
MTQRRKGQPIDPEAKFLSPRQAARILGVSECLVYRLAGTDDMPARRLGGRILIPRDWIESGEVGQRGSR